MFFPCTEASFGILMGDQIDVLGEARRSTVLRWLSSERTGSYVILDGRRPFHAVGSHIANREGSSVL